MSSTPKRFTRYDAEHHDPATEYVLASEHDAHLRELARLQRLADTLTRELEAARRQITALSYPVYLHTNPLLTVEEGGIRYVLEALSDEDGEWFEVKSATPTEEMDLEAFGTSADGRGNVAYARAREALAAYRAAQREDDEASRAY